MMVVLFDATKCKRHGSWIKTKGSGEYTIPNNQYMFHVFCGCMTVKETYKMVTKERGICPNCGQLYTKREKVMLQKFDG